MTFLGARCRQALLSPPLGTPPRSPMRSTPASPTSSSRRPSESGLRHEHRIPLPLSRVHESGRGHGPRLRVLQAPLHTRVVLPEPDQALQVHTDALRRLSERGRVSAIATRMATCPRCGQYERLEDDAVVCTDCIKTNRQPLLAQDDEEDFFPQDDTLPPLEPAFPPAGLIADCADYLTRQR